MIFILPVLCSFSRDAALVLVEVLLSLLGCLGGPRGLFSHASFLPCCTVCAIDDIVPKILLPVFLNAVGKLGRDLFLGFLDVLGVRDGSNLFTDFLILSDLRPPESDNLVADVALDPASSVISSSLTCPFSGSASFSGLDTVLHSVSLEASKAVEVTNLRSCVIL